MLCLSSILLVTFSIALLFSYRICVLSDRFQDVEYCSQLSPSLSLIFHVFTRSQEAQRWASDESALFFECSARAGTHTKDIFENAGAFTINLNTIHAASWHRLPSSLSLSLSARQILSNPSHMELIRKNDALRRASTVPLNTPMVVTRGGQADLGPLRDASGGSSSQSTPGGGNTSSKKCAC